MRAVVPLTPFSRLLQIHRLILSHTTGLVRFFLRIIGPLADAARAGPLFTDFAIVRARLVLAESTVSITLLEFQFEDSADPDLRSLQAVDSLVLRMQLPPVCLPLLRTFGQVAQDFVTPSEHVHIVR
jgi:hypothetical protein